jgi:ribosomal protein S18
VKLTPREEREKERGEMERKKGLDKKVLELVYKNKKILPTYIHYRIKIVP